MATLLYRLGRFSYRRAWLVLSVWLVLLVGIAGGGFALGGQTQESFEIPGTESQEALDRLEAVFPQVAGASAQAVVVAPDGEDIEDERFRPAIDDLVAALAEVDQVDSAIGPFDEYAGDAVAEDGSMAIVSVQFDGPSTDITEGTLEELTATAEIGEDAGLRVEYGGQVFQDNTFGITITEALGVVFAGVVLFVTFGSLVAAGMPILSALVGVGVVIGGITGVTAFTTVSSTAPLLALMIGLAVGIDYSLFILSRHRNQLARGEDPEESTAMAVGTAGSAVLFAGVTVIIALLGLLVVGIPFLSVMGIGAAFAVLVAIGVATTLLPAFLGLLKGRMAPKPGSRAHRRAVAGEDAKPTAGIRWVRGVLKHPVLATVGVLAVLGTLAVPALQLQLSLPDNGSEPEGSTQREAFDLIDEGFGAGHNGPLVIAVDITQTVDVLEDLEDIAAEFEALDDVDYVSQGIPDATLDTAIIRVVPASAPDSEETKQLVEAIRDLAPAIEEDYDTPIAVTGTTAVGIDISNRLGAALLPFGVIVVGLSIVLLMIVFRSVLVPLKAAAGFLLSVVASFGVVVAVFQWGWFADLLHVEQTGPVLSFMPILLMAVLFGLAMDYEVFLVSGMREEYVRTGDARLAVERGFGNGARVVTAAALIMFFVFFAFVPEGAGTIKSIALGLAVGIAFDAFLVRMTLVPAVMALLGRRAWWTPRWLARLLPNVDIEGEELRHHREAVDWALSRQGEAVGAQELVAGSPERAVGPISLSVPAGSLVLASGEAVDRRLMAATLSGRLGPLSGRAHVLGHPLPSDAERAMRLVALADLGSPPADHGVTVGELLAERLALVGGRRRETGDWMRRLDAALGGIRLTPATPVGSLTSYQRAVLLAALALAERTPVVLLDQPDSVDGDEAERFAAAVLALAPASSTLFIGTDLPPGTLRLPDSHGRRVITLDLNSASLEGSTR